MADLYQANALYGGVYHGRVMLGANGSVGGSRHVFVHLQGNNDGLVYPPIGCALANPFKGRAKMYAGDLMEYREDGVGYLLKTYELAEAASTTEIKIVRNGYRHIPFVGDTLMVSGAKLNTTGTGVTVTAVKKSADGTEWEVTLSAAITGSKGDVLVEADKVGTGAKCVVQNPNAYFPCDEDFVYVADDDDNEYDKARYFFTPVLALDRTFLYIDRMSPLPKGVLANNKSKVDGWFQL